MASAASEAVPAPASRITGTPARSVISWKLCGLRMPSPEPMGEPSGMIAAHPTSSSFRASTGSSLVYGSTVKPSSTRISAASSSSIGSGSRVRSSATTSSLTQSVPSASRASRAVSTASPAVKQPAVFGSTRMREPLQDGQHRALHGRVEPAHRDRGQLGAGGDQRAFQHVQAGRPARPHDQPGREGGGSRAVKRSSVMAQPPWTAVRTSTRSPSASAVADHRPRGTTVSLTAAATPEGAVVSAATRRVQRACRRGRSRGSPLTDRGGEGTRRPGRRRRRARAVSYGLLLRRGGGRSGDGEPVRRRGGKRRGGEGACLARAARRWSAPRPSRRR